MLAGDERTAPIEDDVLGARIELDAALDALRAARASWSRSPTGDLTAVRLALDAAERQLNAARVRLQRAVDRRARK